MHGNNIAIKIHLILISNLGIPKSETGNLTILLINIFKIRYVKPTYIIPAIILQIPYGIFIITNTLAMTCAIICAIIKINMATKDMPIAFLYSFYFSCYYLKINTFRITLLINTMIFTITVSSITQLADFVVCFVALIGHV